MLTRLAGREKHEPILYLAGPEDNDRKIAIEKGVPSQNLIAIDRDKRNVENVRATKNPAICSDGLDVLWSWPDDRPVAAVMLDLCGGLTRDVVSIYDVFQRAPLRRAVVMINLQRGRDAFFNDKRDMLQNAGLLTPLWAPGNGGEMVCIHDDVLHRGYLFLMWNSFETVLFALGLAEEPGADWNGEDKCRVKYSYPEADEDGNAEPEFAALCSMQYSAAKPKLFSYRSGVLTFDSAVFEHPARKIESAPAIMRKLFDDDLSGKRDKFSVAKVVRKIAATMAVRTARARV